VSAELFALMERVHGHLALLAVALLMHPVVTLYRRRGATLWAVRSADLAAVAMTVTFMLGWLIYPPYRSWVKPGLLESAAVVAMRFETKEHLAFFCWVLAVSGAAALRLGGAEQGARRLAWMLLLCAWICGTTAGALGIWVAGAAHPAW
jgi:hypothetical protein